MLQLICAATHLVCNIPFFRCLKLFELLRARREANSMSVKQLGQLVGAVGLRTPQA